MTIRQRYVWLLIATYSYQRLSRVQVLSMIDLLARAITHVDGNW